MKTNRRRSPLAAVFATPWSSPAGQSTIWPGVTGWTSEPEVTEPLGCKVPVLAWGLGLERLAMFRFGASHLKELYDGDLDWLREVPLCR